MTIPIKKIEPITFIGITLAFIVLSSLDIIKVVTYDELIIILETIA